MQIYPLPSESEYLHYMVYLLVCIIGSQKCSIA
jgi:hypothetical protein